MLALWEYFWDEADWTPPAPEPEAEADTGRRSNEGGGGPLLYTGPSPDYWEVREKYLKQYTKVIEEAEAITKDNFPSVESRGNLSGDRAGGSAEWQDPLQGMRFELEMALAKARTAPDLGLVESAIGEIYRLVLDIRKIEQQYYDRAISILLLDVF